MSPNFYMNAIVGGVLKFIHLSPALVLNTTKPSFIPWLCCMRPQFCSALHGDECIRTAVTASVCTRYVAEPGLGAGIHFLRPLAVDDQGPWLITTVTFILKDS